MMHPLSADPSARSARSALRIAVDAVVPAADLAAPRLGTHISIRLPRHEPCVAASFTLGSRPAWLDVGIER